MYWSKQESDQLICPSIKRNVLQPMDHFGPKKTGQLVTLKKREHLVSPLAVPTGSS